MNRRAFLTALAAVPVAAVSGAFKPADLAPAVRELQLPRKATNHCRDVFYASRYLITRHNIVLRIPLGELP